MIYLLIFVWSSIGVLIIAAIIWRKECLTPPDPKYVALAKAIERACGVEYYTRWPGCLIPLEERYWWLRKK